MDPLPLGFCIAVSLSLFDPVKKDHPRNPQGMRVLLSDFDLAVDSPDGAFIGRHNGPTAWFVCACQASTVGTRAVITATYPAVSLDPKARVKGVAFQVQSAITSAAPKGTDNPPECAAAKRVFAAGAPIGVVGTAPAQVLPAPVPAIASAPVPAPKEVTAAETAAPENPTGFTAVQTGDGQVQLTWQPVSAASYYVVFGPGSVSGGTKVTGAASYAVTGVPTGFQTFSVASYYDPGPASTSNSAGPDAVSTPAAAFPTASVTVAAPVAAAPAAAPTSATARLTSFDPVKHGFHFHNSFQNSFIGPPVNMTTNGLCGGMSYSVLDYFNLQKAVPLQDYRPANSTTIQSYLYGRQVTSLVTNLDKWVEYSFNPLGARTAEFFN
jgi:hypothetical protein